MNTTTHWAGTNATGLQGFLIWLRQFQPVIYQHVVASLAAKYPQDFPHAPAAANGAALGALGSSVIDPLSFNFANTLPSVSSIDSTASSASTGSPSGGLASDISSIVNSLSSAYLGYTQAQNNSAIINAQLTRAQEGLSPLAITNTSSGIPMISTSSSSWVWIVGGLAAAGAVIYLVSKRKRR